MRLPLRNNLRHLLMNLQARIQFLNQRCEIAIAFDAAETLLGLKESGGGRALDVIPALPGVQSAKKRAAESGQQE